jgi:glycosyltransferase involved in cell wall biosynthesis
MAEELKRGGINCDLAYGYGKRVYANFLLKLMSYNIIYFQKRYSEIDIKLNKLARLLGKKTIFDIDDAPGGTKLSTEAEKQAIEMIKTSSAVIVGSHKLRDFAQDFNKHVYLIHSSINLNYYKPRKEKKDRNYNTLGWIGNGINYKNDLLTFIEPIEELGREHNIRLALIGALGQEEIYHNFGKMKNVTVQIIDSIDWANPIAVPSAISDFDIGLYPLLNNKYNQYKCGFKALEYMAMEIPVVANSVAENKFIVENGKDGFLISNESNWKEYISYLIENKNIREKMGKEGRSKIENNYSLEVCANKLINVFERITHR